ncbi:MAG: phenylalanine--tRNA ligase subunit beta [Candidatus Woesearchaeota archaeon]|jgi:phenylalanyl-tRNA synthetase beta chain
MVVLDTSFKELKKQLGKDLTKDELDQVLFDMGMELEELEGDDVKISITPDRVDMLSMHGLARALKAYLNIQTGMPKYDVELSSVKIFIDKSVEKVRPYTVAAVVDHLFLNDEKIKELIWVQEKLHQTFARGRKKAAIGIYPLDKIIPPIDYFAEDPTKISFLPLGATSEMNGLEILENHPTGIEYAHLLEGEKVFPFFRDSEGNILSMPPIINSELTGRVTEKTKAVFIECSGADLNSLKVLLNIIVAMFHDMGGKIKTVELNYSDKKIISPNFTPEYKTIYVKNINKIIGMDFSAEVCCELLKRMMYDVNIKDKETIEVAIPAFRTDIWHDIDVIDDVARAYGFNKLEPTLTLVTTTGSIRPETQKENMLKSVMNGIGYNQTFTLALSSIEDQFIKMNIKEKEHIKLGQAAEKTLNMIRVWLLPELIKFLSNNRSKTYPQKIFEINDVVSPNHEKDVLCENKKKVSCVSAHSSASFTEIKQVFEYLMSLFAIDYKLEESESDTFIPGRRANVVVNNKNVGVFGEIHPIVLQNWGIDMPMSALELDFDIFM